jgi:glycosyltransferase involved in cell wall biosynthesis
MKKIIHIGQYHEEAFDGVAVTVVGQVDALRRLGFDVEVWSFSGTVDAPEKSQTAAGAPRWKLPVSRSRFTSVLMLPHVTRDWIASRLSEIALFHIHSVFTPRNNLIADLGVPYVITPNGGWSPRVLSGRNRFAKWLWIRAKEKRLWSRATAIQGVSEPEVKEMRQLPGIAPVHLIPNGMAIPDDGEEDPARDRDTWLFIGRLALAQKGLERMVRAYHLCRERGAALPKLVIAGPDFRGGRAELETLIRSLGMENWIHLPGPVTGPAKREALERAGLFLHTSKWEGMPLAMLEAMAHGVPCLATAGTNMMETIAQHGAGYPAGESIAEIADAMERANSGDSRAAGLAAREMVRNKFSWPSVAERLHDVYRPILDRQ